MDKNCINCGKQFYATKKKGADKRKRFCSHACSTALRAKTHRVEINAYLRERRRKLKEIDPTFLEKMAKQARDYRAKNQELVRSYNRKKQNTGEFTENIYFYNYKEPLRRFEEGFGYVGVLAYNEEKDKVQCHLCGKLFRALNNGHLGKVHKTTAREYKETVGLAQSTALIGEGTREKFLNRGHNPNHIEELKKAHIKRKERIASGEKDVQSGSKWALEDYNKRGTCPDQLLDKINKLQVKLGHAPSYEEFILHYDGKYLGSIRRTFGGYMEALKKLHLVPENAIRMNGFIYTADQLIEYLKTFYQVNGRTAKWSDAKRGLVPSFNHYAKVFGSIQVARALADVPVPLHTGPWRSSDERLLSKREKEVLIAHYNGTRKSNA